MALEATPNFGPHLPEESLEKYAFGRLPASELEAAEQHLLVCESCRERLETEDNFAEAMHALGRLKDSPGSPSAFSRFTSRLSAVSDFPARPKTLAAVAAIVLLAGFGFWKLAPAHNKEPETVALAALRGGGQGMTHAGAGRALDLSIDLQAIADSSAAAGGYRVEVVNTAGVQQWTGTALTTGGKLGARMDRPLAAGTYWVRLYAPTGKLLREFGMQIE